MKSTQIKNLKYILLYAGHGCPILKTIWDKKTDKPITFCELSQTKTPNCLRCPNGKTIEQIEKIFISHKKIKEAQESEHRYD